MPLPVIDDLVRRSQLETHTAIKNLPLRTENQRNVHTLPSAASRSLTGVSRTDATKQNDAGSRVVANGYHAKSNIGAGCGSRRDLLTLVSEPLPTISAGLQSIVSAQKKRGKCIE